MASKQQWRARAEKVLVKMAEHAEPYEAKVLGMSITVLPDVYSPHYFPDSAWFAVRIARLTGKKRLLEVGVGTGIIALYAALKDARVSGTDINPAAIRNTRLNFKQYKRPITLWKGDVLTTVPAKEKFDVIFWNHPFNYLPHKEPTMLHRSGFDHRYKGLRTFFTQSKSHLAPGGVVLLGTGNIARIQEISRLAIQAGYKQKLLEKEVMPFTKNNRVPMDLRIYAFTPR